MGDSVNELERYYRTIQPGDLLGKYVLKTFSKGNVPDGDAILQKITEILIHSGDKTGSGLLTFKEMVKELGDLFKKGDITASNFYDRIKIFHDDAKSLPGAKVAYLHDETDNFLMCDILKIDSSEKEATKFGVIMSTTPMVSLSVRDTNKVSLFMNAIPTIEMSRCMPYLDIIFQFRREEKSPNTLRSPSLLKFLNGGLELKDDKSADRAMFDASQDTEAGPGGEKKTIHTAGMELVAATQLLFNPSSIEGGSARRFTPILDAFRPFMSIESFEVSVASAGVGVFSNKTAKLNLILHDRSRLAEISDFVRPQVYTNTTLSISYGWKHPDRINGDNAYGDLLNQMVVKNEKFGIVNASFSFDNAQQIHITLSLATKGMQEMRVVKISEGDGYANQQRALEQLMEDVNRLREKAGLKKPEIVNKEIRPYMILESVSNGQLMTAFKGDEMEKLIKNLSADPNRETHNQLAEALDKIFKKDEGFLAKQNSTIASFIKEKMDKLREGPDPFMDANVYTGEIEQNGKKKDTPPGGPRKPKSYVSLAKTLLVFVVEPLLNSPNFDEIQLVFYQFNSQAGKARDTSIGSFPIEIEFLTQVFNDHVYNKRNVDMTIQEFVLLIQSAIINDPRAAAYGLRNKYKSHKPGEPPVFIEGQGKKSKIEDAFSEIMEGQGGSFKFPAVEAYLECRGGRVLKNGTTNNDKSAHDILRIHIYDKQASPYEQFLQMARTQTGLQEIVTRADSFYGTQQKQQVADAVNTAGIGLKVEIDPKTGATTITSVSAEAIKKVVSSALPTLTYGTNNSAIISAHLATQQNQLLAAAQMLKSAGQQNNTEPNGSSVGGIPLRVIPCQLDMETFGCALLSLNQRYFIDFSTGTTADNIYILTHIDHKIKQGSFTSHLKFTPDDSYGVLESVISKVDQLSAILKKDAPKLQKPKS